ncbi:hypothetical protein VW35_04675 [Devosia soli]|uniref:Uncharacterized protein n=1 Tax=Devosia soli TaxID=361041 RepID=A0A0F5LBZ1_9HYPH|nr:hypothetical protein VW35_04675 [Devosia soli]
MLGFLAPKANLCGAVTDGAKPSRAVPFSLDARFARTTDRAKKILSNAPSISTAGGELLERSRIGP